jgi:hypothetical protein
VARLSLALEGTSMTKEPPVPDANPPRWAERLLRLVLSPRDRETVTGDLLEEYREVAVPTLGPFRARMWYLREMVGFMKNATAAAVVGLSAVISLAVVIGSAVLFVFMHRDSSMTSAETADRQFQALRARFADQQPLLDMEQRQARAEAGPPATNGPLHTIHTVIFDTRGGRRLVQMSVPYWLARTFAGRGDLQWLGELTFFDDTEFDPERIRLSLDQIERHGAGLIVDYRHPSGGQFISWVD